MAGTLAVRYIAVDITTPAGTAIAAAQVTAVDLTHVILVAAHLRIPAGHAGFTGLRIDYSGTTIVPYSNPAKWIVGDDDRFDFDVDYEVGRTLQVITYNLDVNAHDHHLLMKVTDVGAPDRTAPLTLVPIVPA